jgi:hypothetical protein
MSPAARSWSNSKPAEEMRWWSPRRSSSGRWSTASRRRPGRRVDSDSRSRDRIYWLATGSPDGRPHVRPILGRWLDGAFYFITAETTWKARTLAADPRCAIASSSTALPAVDVVVEDDAVKVTDDAKVRRVADAYASTMQWPLEVRDGAVLGPSGSPPYAVFELTRKTVVGLPGVAGMEEGQATFCPTRWRFQASRRTRCAS